MTSVTYFVNIIGNVLMNFGGYWRSVDFVFNFKLLNVIRTLIWTEF